MCKLSSFSSFLNLNCSTMFLSRFRNRLPNLIVLFLSIFLELKFKPNEIIIVADRALTVRYTLFALQFRKGRISRKKIYDYFII